MESALFLGFWGIKGNKWHFYHSLSLPPTLPTHTPPGKEACFWSVYFSTELVLIPITHLGGVEWRKMGKGPFPEESKSHHRALSLSRWWNASTTRSKRTYRRKDTDWNIYEERHWNDLSENSFSESISIICQCSNSNHAFFIPFPRSYDNNMHVSLLLFLPLRTKNTVVAGWLYIVWQKRITHHAVMGSS